MVKLSFFFSFLFLFSIYSYSSVIYLDDDGYSFEFLDENVKDTQPEKYTQRRRSSQRRKENVTDIKNESIESKNIERKKIAQRRKENVTDIKNEPKKSKVLEKTSFSFGLRASLDISSGLGYSFFLCGISRPVAGMFVMPELGFGISNSTINFQNIKSNLNINSVVGNIFFGYKFGFLGVYLGPSINYTISHKFNNVEPVDSKFTYEYDNLCVASTFGVGTSFKKVYLDFRYSYYLAGNLDMNLQNGIMKTTFFENNFKVCLGFFF